MKKTYLTIFLSLAVSLSFGVVAQDGFHSGLNGSGGNGLIPPQTITSTGSQNNLAINTGISQLRLNNATDLTITGFAAGSPGQRIDLISVGAGNVFLAPQSGSSTAANQIINYVTVGNTPLAAGTGTASIEYDGTTARWRLIAHDQGAWLTPAYASGDYTALASMTWTVDSGDVTNYSYWLKGRTLTLSMVFATTTVGGSVSPELHVTMPNGYTAAKPATSTTVFNDAGGAQTVGQAFTAAAVTYVAFSKVPYSNLSLATNNTKVQSVVITEVQ